MMLLEFTQILKWKSTMELRGLMNGIHSAGKKKLIRMM